MINVAIIMGKMDSGGKKTLAMEYFRHIKQDDIRFHFVCDADSQAVPEEEIHAQGGRIHYVTPYQHIFKNMHEIRALCMEEHFDIMHAYNSTMNFFPLLAGKLAKVPVRISESLSMAHDREPKTYAKKILRLTSKFCATHYTSCGEDCGRWQFGNEFFDQGKVDVFKTAIDSGKQAFNPALRQKTREEYGLESKFVVGYIGRFVPQKNPLFMLRIFKEIQSIRKNAVLLLIGDGPLKDEMFDQIDAEGIGNAVCYLGRREDVTQFYQAMDCFLLPSLYEGLPVVGLDAQCSGLPIFFSDSITKEVSFSPLCSFVSLEASPREWAEIIEEATSSQSPRRSYSSQAKSKGFDSVCESARLERYYRKALDSSENR